MRLVIYDRRIGLESFSRDPIGFAGGQYSLYSIVNNRALIGKDPSGLFSFPAGVVQGNFLIAVGPTPVPGLWYRISASISADPPFFCQSSSGDIEEWVTASVSAQGEVTAGGSFRGLRPVKNARGSKYRGKDGRFKKGPKQGGDTKGRGTCKIYPQYPEAGCKGSLEAYLNAEAGVGVYGVRGEIRYGIYPNTGWTGQTQCMSGIAGASASLSIRGKLTCSGRVGSDISLGDYSGGTPPKKRRTILSTRMNFEMRTVARIVEMKRSEISLALARIRRVLQRMLSTVHECGLSVEVQMFVKVFGCSAIAYALILFGLLTFLPGLLGTQTKISSGAILAFVVAVGLFIPFALSYTRLGLNTDEFESQAQETRKRHGVLARECKSWPFVLYLSIALGIGLWIYSSMDGGNRFHEINAVSISFSALSGLWFIFVYPIACKVLNDGPNDDGQVEACKKMNRFGTK